LKSLRIGCIAWGSLLWDPRTLPLASGFRDEGPMLPIEFSRVALDGRVTLVIDPEAPPVQTFWAPLAVDSLDEAVRELARREGVPNGRVGDWIGVEARPGLVSGAGQATRETRAEISGWLARQPLDAVLWTALPARGPDGRFERPGWRALIAHLEGLEGEARARAEQYIRRAPFRLRSPNRLRFEAVFGWSPQDAAIGGG
jgi:hypothetical protein